MKNDLFTHTIVTWLITHGFYTLLTHALGETAHVMLEMTIQHKLWSMSDLSWPQLWCLYIGFYFGQDVFEKSDVEYKSQITPRWKVGRNWHWLNSIKSDIRLLQLGRLGFNSWVKSILYSHEYITNISRSQVFKVMNDFYSRHTTYLTPAWYIFRIIFWFRAVDFELCAWIVL